MSEDTCCACGADAAERCDDCGFTYCDSCDMFRECRVCDVRLCEDCECGSHPEANL